MNPSSTAKFPENYESSGNILPQSKFIDSKYQNSDIIDDREDFSRSREEEIPHIQNFEDDKDSETPPETTR